MSGDKKYFEIDYTAIVQDDDLIVLGRGTNEDGSLATTALDLKNYINNPAFNSNKPITRNVDGFYGVNIGASTVLDFLEGAFFPATAPVQEDVMVDFTNTLKNYYYDAVNVPFNNPNGTGAYCYAHEIILAIFDDSDNIVNWITMPPGHFQFMLFSIMSNWKMAFVIAAVKQNVTAKYAKINHTSVVSNKVDLGAIVDNYNGIYDYRYLMSPTVIGATTSLIMEAGDMNDAGVPFIFKNEVPAVDWYWLFNVSFSNNLLFQANQNWVSPGNTREYVIWGPNTVTNEFRWIPDIWNLLRLFMNSNGTPQLFDGYFRRGGTDVLAAQYAQRTGILGMQTNDIFVIKQSGGNPASALLKVIDNRQYSNDAIVLQTVGPEIVFVVSLPGQTHYFGAGLSTGSGVTFVMYSYDMTFNTALSTKKYAVHNSTNYTYNGSSRLIVFSTVNNGGQRVITIQDNP